MENKGYIYKEFDEVEASKIKEIEKVTNHDVKAIEMYLRNKFDDMGFKEYKNWIHFGLTSQDINNTALGCMVNDLLDLYKKKLLSVKDKIESIAKLNIYTPMLSRTHGQWN